MAELIGGTNEFKRFLGVYSILSEKKRNEKSDLS
jgi:hypothetical protein